MVVKVGRLYTTAKNQHRFVLGVKKSKVYYASRGGNAAADYNSCQQQDELNFLGAAFLVGTVPAPEKKRIREKFKNYIKSKGI